MSSMSIPTSVLFGMQLNQAKLIHFNLWSLKRMVSYSKNGFSVLPLQFSNSLIIHKENTKEINV